MPKFAELLSEVPESVCWAMTTRKVHLLPAADAPPWCAQRKGSRAKKLSRVAASGTGVELLLSLGVEDQVDLCTDCLVAFSKCENGARAVQCVNISGERQSLLAAGGSWSEESPR